MVGSLTRPRFQGGGIVRSAGLGSASGFRRIGYGKPTGMCVLGDAASSALACLSPCRAALVALLPRPVPTSSIVPLPDDLVRSAVAAIPAQSRPTRKRKVEAVSRAAAPPPTVAAKSAAPLPPVAAGSAAATPLSSPAASDVPTSISDEALAAVCAGHCRDTHSANA